MKNDTYLITLRWSEDDDSWVATVPALAGCSAWGDSPSEAIKEVIEAKEVWLESAAAHGKSIPAPDATREQLSAMAPLLNMSYLARESGISPQTLASKLKRGTAFNDSERTSIGKVLASHGMS